MPRDPIFVFAVLCLAVALSEWLARKSFLRHLGSALLVIAITAVFANLGLVPPYDTSGANAEVNRLYDGVFGYGVHVGIFWLLLLVNLKDLRRAGGQMIVLFSLGACGTIAGVVAGMQAVGGSGSIGEHWRAIGGMFVGTYTGGSANLNLIAADYGVARDGALFVGANAVDAILTTFYMVATIALPRLLWRAFPGSSRRRLLADAQEAPADDAFDAAETLHPLDLGILLALGAGGTWVSDVGTAALNSLWEGFAVPEALVLTTVALALAQVPAIARLRGTRVLGLFAVMLFLAVIGCLCDLGALERLGDLAGTLWLFASIVIGVHALVIFGLAGLFRLDWDMAAVASQANVGGGTTAIALARSLARPDLVLPGILVGALGTASGTFLGVFTIEWLLR